MLVLEEGCYHQGRARFPPTPPSPQTLKKKKIQNTLPPTVPPRPASIPSPACVQRAWGAHGECLWLCQAAGKRGPGVRKGPGPSARRARGRRAAGGAARKRALAVLRAPASSRMCGRPAAARCERGRAWAGAGPGVLGAAQAASWLGPQPGGPARARSPSLAAEFMAVLARTSAVRAETAPSPAPSAARRAPPLRAGDPAAPPPRCLRRGPGPSRSHSRVRPPSSGSRPRAAPAPGRGRAGEGPARAGRGVRGARARGSRAARGAARRGAAETGHTPAPARRRRDRRGLCRPRSEPRPAARAGSPMMKGKGAPSPPGSQAGAFVGAEIQTALSSPPPPRQKCERGLEEPRRLLDGSCARFSSSPSRSCALWTGKSGAAIVAAVQGLGGGCRFLCKFGFAGAPAPCSVRAPGRASDLENLH